MDGALELGLEEARARCRQLGRLVSVQVDGAEAALIAADAATLKARRFTLVLKPKSAITGAAATQDWVDGASFELSVRRLISMPSSSVRATPYRGANYDGTFTFTEMLAACREHGEKIVIGFDGGRAALRRARSEYLRTRDYKYDWADSPSGRKDAANWFTGAEFLKMLADRDLADG